MNTKHNCYRLDTKKVKVLQIQKEVSGLAIAAQSGFSRAEISRHIQGDGRRFVVQQAIARALGVALDDIVLKPEIVAASEQPQAA